MHFSLHRVILILDETWHTAFHIELLGDALFSFLFICRRYLKTKRMKTVSSGIAVTVLLFVDNLWLCSRRSSSEKVLHRHLE